MSSIAPTGRRRGSKVRSPDELLEQRWRRLHAAGKVEMRPGATSPPWLDAFTLLFAAINSVPGHDLAGSTWTRAQRQTLCELAVHACERAADFLARPRVYDPDIEHLAAAVVRHRLDEAVTRELLGKLAAAYPGAKMPLG